MGTRPGFGFKTDVEDEELADEILESIENEFDNVTYDENRLYVGDEWVIIAIVLEGSNEYMGMMNDGLAFSHCAYNWPEWDEFESRASFLDKIREFVDEKFESIRVEELRPLTPTS